MSNPHAHPLVRRVHAWRCRATRVRLRTSGAVALLAVGAIVSLDAVAASAHPTGGAHGVDVSSHQHPGGAPIDWKRVRASGVSFAYIKATEGPSKGRSTYRNPWFKRDWDAAGAAGLQRGAYHYARPRLPISTAGYDADQFMYLTGMMQGPRDLPAVLDLEETGGLSSANLLAWANAWVAEVVRATGVRPIVYSAWWFLEHAVAQSSKLASSALWIADYSNGSQPRRVPSSWPRWSIWQYTGSGTVPGIKGPVDRNVACSLATYGPANSRFGSCQGRQPTTSSTTAATSTASKSTAKSSTSTTKKQTTTKTATTTTTTTTTTTKRRY